MKVKAVRHHTLILLFFFVSLPILSEIYKDTRHTKEEEGLAVTTTEPSLLYTGDIMLGRNVEKIGTLSGFDFAFKNIKSLLFDNTYVISNLEGPIPESKRHKRTPSNGFSFSFSNEIVSVLSEYHVSAVSLANNHTSDQGEEGYLHTISILTNESIGSFGHSRHFSHDYITNSLGNKNIVTLGINLITPHWNEEETLSGVRAICEKNKDAFVFAFIHAGTEYTHDATGYQVDFAHKLIDTTCVHTIIGSHPHVVQGIELYKNHYIFYSLGNFIFDQYFSEETQEGYVLQVKNRDGLLAYTVIPIVQEMSVPRIAEGEKKDKILNDIKSHSTKEIGNLLEEGRLSEIKGKDIDH